MNDFGADASGKVLELYTKGLEMFFKLLKYILESGDRRTERKYKEMLLEKNGKVPLRKTVLNKAKELFAHKKGQMKLSELLKSGEQVVPAISSLSKEELERFSKLCDLEEIPFATMQDSVVVVRYEEAKAKIAELEELGTKDKLYIGENGEQSRGKGEFDINNLSEEQQAEYNRLQKELKDLQERRESVVVLVKKSDLPRVQNLWERLKDEIRLDEINKKKREYEEKGEENLTDEERRDYEELKEEEQELIRDGFDEFNDRNNDIIVSSAEGNPRWEEMSFESAVARTTDRGYATEPCYICDRTNPDNYIEVSSKEEIYVDDKGTMRPYVNTEYKVYNNGVQQNSDTFNHGKFTHHTNYGNENTSEKGKENWKALKEEMKEKGGFSDDVVLFANKERYQEYMRDVKETKANSIPEEKTILNAEDGIKYKDYKSVIDDLKSQLKEKGYSFNENKEVVSDKGEVLSVKSNMTKEQKLEVAEMINIGKQIENYEMLNNSQTKMAMALQQMEKNEKDLNSKGVTEEKKAMFEEMKVNLENEIASYKEQTSSYKEEIAQLQEERLKYQSVEIVERVQDDSIPHEDTKEKFKAHEKETSLGLTKDENFKEFLNSKNEVSVGDVQLNLQIGYNKAIKVMQSLESEGVLSNGDADFKEPRNVNHEKLNGFDMDIEKLADRQGQALEDFEADINRGKDSESAKGFSRENESEISLDAVEDARE